MLLRGDLALAKARAKAPKVARVDTVAVAMVVVAVVATGCSTTTEEEQRIDFIIDDYDGFNQ